MVNIPPKTDRVWKDLLNGTISIQFEFMAINLLLFNQKNKVTNDPAEMNSAIDAVYKFFEDSIDIPKVQNAVEELKKL